MSVLMINRKTKILETKKISSSIQGNQWNQGNIGN